VAYGNGTFAAVGYDATIVTSPDLTTWTLRRRAPRRVGSIAFGNQIFVAFSTDGSNMILNSSDGISWNELVSPMPSLNLINLAYGSNTFVGVGSGGNQTPPLIITSQDGVSWTVRDSGVLVPGTTFGPNLFGVQFLRDRFFAVGNYGTILSSPDGATWATNSTASQTLLLDVTFGNNTFVAAGLRRSLADSTILTSQDGVIWTNRGSPGEVDLYSVTFGKNAFVAVGNLGNDPDLRRWRVVDSKALRPNWSQSSGFFE